MFIICEWREEEKRLTFFLLSRTDLFARRSLCKLNFLTRARDKGRSPPQAPSPAGAGCHPRHFDIDEGNLREHCWRRRLMRRVRARAPKGSRGPLYPRPSWHFLCSLSLSVSCSLFLSSSACCMMNCISTPYALRTIVLRDCRVIRRIIARVKLAPRLSSVLSRLNDADERYFARSLLRGNRWRWHQQFFNGVKWRNYYNCCIIEWCLGEITR